MRKTGIELIAEERHEQIEKHGFTLEHDLDCENNGGLANSALYLLLNYCGYENNEWAFPTNWDKKWIEKFNNKGDVESLYIAGALIAAEIDRLQSNNFQNGPATS